MVWNASTIKQLFLSFGGLKHFAKKHVISLQPQLFGANGRKLEECREYVTEKTEIYGGFRPAWYLHDFLVPLTQGFVKSFYGYELLCKYTVEAS